MWKFLNEHRTTVKFDRSARPRAQQSVFTSVLMSGSTARGETD